MRNNKAEAVRTVATLEQLFHWSHRNFPENLQSRVLDGGASYTYSDFYRMTCSLSERMASEGIGAGEKVAVLSTNMPQWTMAFFSAVAFGRIAVPILPESAPNEIGNILAHSGASVLFVTWKLLNNVPREALCRLRLVFDIETFEVIGQDSPEGLSRPDRESHPGHTSVQNPDNAFRQASPDDLACIIYTSGTTGNAKGVMLSHGNLTSCVQSCYSTQYRDQSDRWLSICPMAHTLELTVGTLYPLLVGASVHYLSRPAVPSILLKAMQEVRPTTILIVPLIIEKIYRNSVLPTIRKSRVLSWMSRNMEGLLCRIVGMKLRKTFGGKVDFLGIGGAKLDIEVERFLLKAGFPYAVGYGLTETSPLLSYSVGRLRVPGTIGLPVENVRMKLINVNPQTGEGEIVAKGPNVMLGYYREPQKTAEVFTPDGWFRTGDLASVDERGRFYIKGRRTNMILGPSGENIYPEDIEQVINSVAPVNESLVVSRGGRLVALVNFNEDALDWNREGEEEFFRKIEEYKTAILDFVNKNVKKTSRVNDIQVVREPFEKTATRKIRRFKYTVQ